MNAAHRILQLTEFLLPGSSNPSGARQGLQRLLLLRTFVACVCLLGLLAFQAFADLEIPLGFIGLLLSAVAASVLLGVWRLKQSWLIGNLELFCHILLDVIFLVSLVLNTGGVMNPLISYLLVLLAVTATLLPSPYVYGFAVSSIVLYTFFLLLDLQADHAGGYRTTETDSVFQLHLVGMWVIFLVSAILITVFITRMATAIRERELNLAKARENEIRNEQLVAIGTLAAGTAHALGTPLSTMAVLLTELDKLESEELARSEVKEDISVLKQQVIRCKESLNQLIRYYNKDNPITDESSSLTHFVGDIRDYIRNVHPTATVDFRIEANSDPRVNADLSIKHAIINIIENSIKAAVSRVEVDFSMLQDHRLQICIRDDGPGIPVQVMEKLGEPFISMRKDSMGLGIFLANAAIQRLGGTIEMFNMKAGGALTQLKLPAVSQ